MPPRASLLTLLGTLAVALGALGLAIAAPGESGTRALFEAGGALGLTSSRDGDTLFTAAGMRPGGAVSGTLRVTNTGAAAEILALRTARVADRAGVGGGLLSGRLALIVSDVSGSGAPVQLWAGRPGDLDEAPLGMLPAGASRDLVVTAALPATGTGNDYQGASVSLGLTWGVRPLSDGTTATPTPVPTAAPVAVPPVPATPAPVATPTDVGADELGLPGAKACLSRRRFAIHLRAPHGGRIVIAVVRVGRARPVTVRGHGKRILAAKVDLRRFKRRAVTVKIDIRTTDVHHYRTRRKYHICAGR